MIHIQNTCLVCGGKNTFKFRDSDQGDDLPDGPWTVPCKSCQSQILSQLTEGRIEGEDEDDAYYYDAVIVMECQRGNDDVISAVRENRLQAWLDANRDYPFYADMNKHHYQLMAHFWDKAKPKKSDGIYDDNCKVIIPACPQCGNRSIESDHLFCECCGFDLKEFFKTMDCCGSKLMIVGRNVLNFCPFCGVTVKSHEAGL